MKQGDVILERITQLEEPARESSKDDADDIEQARLRRQERIASMS